MSELEKDIEARVCAWARKRGLLSLKFTSPSNRGWPDRVFIAPEGRYLWIEFKMEGNVPTKLQIQRIKKLRAFGCMAMWADSYELAIQYLQDFINEGPQ